MEDKNLKIDTEQISMLLIAHSGEARSLVFRALSKAREGDFTEADSLLSKAGDESLTAHKLQTQLLISEANGIGPDINVLLIHAQDHLMTSILAKEIIEELITMYKNK